MNVQLTPRQEIFLSRLMKPMSDFVSPNSPVYWDFVLKMLNEQYLNPNALATSKAREMMFSIVERIQYAYFDDQIDEILIGVESIPSGELPENTKVQSMKKSKKNSSKGHLLIRSALQSSNEPLSRTELANLTNLRLSSVCARVVELIEEGEIQVAGTKHDKESDRMVETLELV